MGRYGITFSEEEKELFLEELLKRLENGEDRNLRLAQELGIAANTVKVFRKKLIDERKNYRRKNKKSSRRKKTKRKRQ